MSEYTIKTVNGSVVRFDDAEDGLPLTKCEVDITPKVEIGTVSGSISAFSDGADDVPLRSCEVTIAPNLEGKNSVMVTHGKKNFLSLIVDYPNFEKETNGVTMTLLSDGKVKFNGTATANTDFTFYSYSNVSVPKLYVKNGTYTFSNIGNYNIRMVVSGAGNNGFAYRELYGGSTWTSTVTDDTKPFNYVVFRISSGVELENEIVEPMLECGSSASFYEPYVAPTTYTAQLGRTIYGGSVDVVNGTGTDGYLKYVVDGVNNYAVNVSGTNFNIMPYGLTGIDGTTANWVCDTLTANNTNFGYNSSNGFIFFRQAAWSSLSGVTDVATFNAYCQEHPITFLFPLTTPTDFTFTPIPINTYLGDNTMWSDGDLSVAYYKKGYNTKKVNVLHYEKNILKISNNNYNNGQKCNYIITEDGIEVTATGTYARAGFAISIKSGVTYTFSFRGHSTSTYRRIYLNSNVDTPWSNPTYNGFQLTDTDTEYSRTFIASTDILFIGFYVTAAETTGTMTVSDIMLEVSESASEYEPYIVPTTHTVNLGRTIYGGSADIAIGKGSETHGNVVFDGTEGTGGTPSWTMISVTQGTMFRLTVPGKATTSATNTACSYYTPTAQAQRADGTVSGAGEYVDIIDNRFSSVDAFKEWLAENSVALVYELATPVPFTFTPINLTSNSSNTLWSTEGDITVSYYSYIETDGRYIISGSTLTDIADAIREKTSIVGPINVNDFITDIMTIDNSAPDAEEVEF